LQSKQTNKLDAVVETYIVIYNFRFKILSICCHGFNILIDLSKKYLNSYMNNILLPVLYSEGPCKIWSHKFENYWCPDVEESFSQTLAHHISWLSMPYGHRLVTFPL
jgi:hypothetical protein